MERSNNICGEAHLAALKIDDLVCETIHKFLYLEDSTECTEEIEYFLKEITETLQWANGFAAHRRDDDGFIIPYSEEEKDIIFEAACFAECDKL